jgi:hypothetical protein
MTFTAAYMGLLIWRGDEQNFTYVLASAAVPA